MPALQAQEDLFRDVPVSSGDKWVDLVKEINSAEVRASLVAYWRQSYDVWKGLYRQFRDVEHALLYAATPQGNPPTPDEGILRGHRVTIYSLSEKGERLAELLHSVASLSYTKEEKDEANECKQRIGNLLEALRESISLWHPANKPSPAAKKMLEAIFSESQ
jgi:hypothetical protein